MKAHIIVEITSKNEKYIKENISDIAKDMIKYGIDELENMEVSFLNAEIREGQRCR